MTDRQLQKLLDRTAKVSEMHLELSRRVTEAFRGRYGTTHSDVDADEIIDSLEYGAGPISIEKCDEAMSLRGYPPLAPLPGPRLAPEVGGEKA
jgi:hypothetical protein